MNTHGFECIRQEKSAELGGTARLWRHAATGAELLSISNADENKCFGVAFRTPPSDSSGVAHILEHAALCGSEKYPVREPFVELLKGSLQTFLNAFTFPDKTCYPVASANEQDFYNLVDVYLDAVFHPRISEDVFRQEGWHVDAPAADAPWAYKGVVYNEMKGAYSSPDHVLAEHSQQAVFPDTLYSLDSGGDPESILALTYENFKNFHETYYHPSNARFFFWGDDPEERRLAVLGGELSRHTARPVRSDVPPQPRLAMPRHLEIPYAASENEDRAMFTVNWLLCETADIETALILEMLEHILEGLPGSPLRKALIDSGLGEDTTGVGLETDLRQMYYSVGLKGLAAADVPKAEMLIHETLAALAEEGIDPDAVEAAVNSVEFALRENNSGRFPRGLEAMIRSLSTWLYDGDPLAPLCWEAPLAGVKARLAAGEKIFENALRRWFLENEHRAVVALLPDHALGARREAKERAALDALRASCSEAERAAMARETARLAAAQEAPDSPEALASIPGLELKDLPPRNVALPLEERRAGTLPFLLHDLDASGITYVNLLLPLEHVPAHLLPLVPLLGRTLTETGTRRHDFVRMGMRVAAKTGGIHAAAFLSAVRGQSLPAAYLSMGGKAVDRKAEDLFDLLGEMLLEPALMCEERAEEQRRRFSQMLLESKARLEHGLVAAGHIAVSLRLRARYTLAGRLEELMTGISHLLAVRELIRRMEEDWEGVLDDLRRLYLLIVRRQGALFDCTASAAAGAEAQALAARLGGQLPERPVQEPRPDWACSPPPEAEVFTAPAQVNYVGKGANLYALGYRCHGSAQVVLRHLRMGYLWEKVRVQGGAYGAFCALDRLDGTLVQASYRDPSVDRTLEVYDGAAAYLRGFKPDSRELTRAVIGAIGELDAHMLPDAKGAAALTRFLSKDAEDARQTMREEILGTTAKHFNEFAEVMAEAAQMGGVCVLGGSGAEAAAEKHGWPVAKLL